MELHVIMRDTNHMREFEYVKIRTHMYQSLRN